MACDNPIDFLVVGAQKAGTTALHEFLMKHPTVDMPQRKELHYFDEDSEFSTSPVDYSSYHSHFAPCISGRMRGEVTPIYMYWEPSIKRIWKYNPSIKIIVLLRNPIERAYSHWQMEVNRKADNVDFIEAITTESNRCRLALPNQHRVYSYIDRGFYSEQLRKIWRYFPKRNVLVVNSDELKDSAKSIMSDVCRHLSIEDFQQDVALSDRVFEGRYQEKMSDDARQFLTKTFEFEIKQLERMLDWDLSGWLE